MESFEFEIFFIILTLILYIVGSRAIKVHSITLFHQSAIAMLMGAFVSILLRLIYSQHQKFSSLVFFDLILPPIIFASGFSLRKSLFYQNLSIISVLGLLGTILCFIFLFSVCSFVNQHLFHLFSQSELMLLACVLCATDSVAVLGIVKADIFPRLNSILFSEGIVNDATAIILFRTVLEYGSQIQSGIHFGTLALLTARFVMLLVLSMAVGLGFGLALTFYFRWQQQEEQEAVKEVALVMLTCYVCYLVAEQINLSGIISLFTCGIIMGSYCVLNLSPPAQRGIGMVLQSMSYLAEGFIYVYLGLQVMDLRSNSTSIWFALVLLPLMPLARIFSMVSLIVFNRLCGRKSMSWKEYTMLWYSGIMRGAIAFALSFQIESKNKEVLVRVVLILVLATSLIIPLLSKTFTEKIGLMPQQSYERQQDKAQSLEDVQLQEEGLWDRIQNRILMPIFIRGHNRPIPMSSITGISTTQRYPNQ